MSGEASPIGREPFAEADALQDGHPQTIDSPVVAGGEQPAGGSQSDQQGKPAGGPDPAEEPGADRGSGAPSAAEIAQELAALRLEHDTVRSQYMRIAADFDNFRKRQSRDQEDLRLQITCSTLSEILPVVDNFDRARQQLNPQSEEAQGLHRSYQVLYEQLVKVFKQLGVAPMRVEGEVFDPMLHEAVLREPSERYPEDFIVEELQRGYQLDGRVLRHALVKVSMGPGPTTDPAEPNAGQDSSAGDGATL
ncbi:nucleotide exchange factor GrpE [Synechococcus sp. CS-602]|uniref:nucleotide exchange factor GrpE n=1 Tax=Synechococcaceae TaxID=1890426 RepID=UPI0008FF681F|nr:MULTISPECIES: nucleotide exchange factor GrpE [Synechococcaceae]MCT4364848.1 nucleotide exchange factor GrpE [Candidatus Regnicoccus frigidus MAG-AL1]APD48128.1 nucleotide exchange factor GrpE [Synechococcus sp. SynAce01]MCT0203351.1 nucleotide exchange factor GrpE [Synechococcus sp. CS-603]MCT0203999.1 nucleotide exchange factor GrpE [Synechococcus sp. CS-602]MCT0246571.1 nucleotide exchange factor GrpE [Synechococcus sp. CS-601]